MYIENKQQVTEFEIQAYLYNELLKRGYEVRWEIVDTSISKELWNKKWFRQSRFDLVIFKEWVAKIIIEVKKPWKKFTLNTRQYSKYKLYWLPIMYFNEYEQLDEILPKIFYIIKPSI